MTKDFSQHSQPWLRRPAIHPALRFLAAAVVAAGIVGAGCGPQDPRVMIQGTVALDGEPLSQGQVVFMPRDKALRAEGAAVKDGGFTIRVHKGPHRVEINAEVEERRPTAPDAPPEAGIIMRSLIPPRYNERSTLECDVQSAKDRPAFDLTSGK